MVVLTCKTELNSEINMSSLNFDFHLKVRPSSLSRPVPSCFLAILAGMDCGLLLPPKQPQVPPEYYTINYTTQEGTEGKGPECSYLTGAFILSSYFPGQMMFKADFFSLGPSWIH